MKIRMGFAALTIAAATAMTCVGQDRMSDSFRKGVVEEKSSHNLNAAIQDYQTTLTQFDEARQTAATALLRMAECYRKLGKDDLAIAAYRRVLQKFAGQSKLVEQSRAVLTNIDPVAGAETPVAKPQAEAQLAAFDAGVPQMAAVKK